MEFDVHPGVLMGQKAIAGLKQKTGRSAEEWKTLLEREAPADEKERVSWLKTEHQLGSCSP